MEEYVAVKPPVDLEIKILFPKRSESWLSPKFAYSKLSSSLKREALLFDKIYIWSFREKLDLSKDITTELEWLVDQKIVTLVNGQKFLEALSLTPDPLGFDEWIGKLGGLEKLIEKIDHRQVINASSQLEKEVEEFFKKAHSGKTEQEIEEQRDNLSNAIEDSIELGNRRMYRLSFYYVRLYTLYLEYFEKIIATPLLSYKSYNNLPQRSISSDVLQVVIQDLPVPDGNTPWEKIIEYRENLVNQNDLRNLRRWMRKLSTENLSAAECKQELSWLRHEFQSHLNLHKIKAETGMVETIIKVPLEILENLVTLKFSKLPDPFFAIKKRQISLMDAELNTPGREIAFLIKSKQAFEQKI